MQQKEHLKLQQQQQQRRRQQQLIPQIQLQSNKKKTPPTEVQTARRRANKMRSSIGRFSSECSTEFQMASGKAKNRRKKKLSKFFSNGLPVTCFDLMNFPTRDQLVWLRRRLKLAAASFCGSLMPVNRVGSTCSRRRHK